jgi:colicin import membrane protein
MRTLLLGLLCAALITAGAATAQSTATNNPLTNEEIGAFRAAVSQVWNASGYKGIVTIRVRLNPDGTLAAPPQVVSKPDGPNFAAAGASAIKAIQLSQPFRMLKPDSYDAWKFMDIDFDPTTAVTNPQQPRRKFDMEKIKALLAKEKAQSMDSGADGKN